MPGIEHGLLSNSSKLDIILNKNFKRKQERQIKEA